MNVKVLTLTQKKVAPSHHISHRFSLLSVVLGRQQRSLRVRRPGAQSITAPSIAKLRGSLVTLGHVSRATDALLSQSKNGFMNYGNNADFFRICKMYALETLCDTARASVRFTTLVLIMFRI